MRDNLRATRVALPEHSASSVRACAHGIRGIKDPRGGRFTSVYITLQSPNGSINGTRMPLALVLWFIRFGGT